ncbi:MAG TPA: hypothetical protein G4O15_03060 [Dehalococcoidia bacterium]|nr:hypothetical protein [Dehalococcoidia bacterium]
MPTKLLVTLVDLHDDHGYHHYQETTAEADEHTSGDIVDEKPDPHTEKETDRYGYSRDTLLLVLTL